eukprot:4661531-Prymnesium_polylepis.1
MVEDPGGKGGAEGGDGDCGGEGGDTGGHGLLGGLGGGTGGGVLGGDESEAIIRVRSRLTHPMLVPQCTSHVFIPSGTVGSVVI